jgi:HEAT repeat protein
MFVESKNMRLAIDALSFWLGFGSAALIALLLWSFRRQLAEFRAAISDSLRGFRERLTAGAERNWREDIYRYAQTAHVAGMLFPLQEIQLAPRFFFPEPEIDPNRVPEDEDINTIIPVLPEWPDLAGIYRAPTVSVEQAFTGTQSIVVLGGLGSGKTTLLAQLTSRAAGGDEALFPESPTPIFVHAADLHFGDKPSADVAAPLVAAAQLRASALTAARLARHLRFRLKEFNCVILLDGFDELPVAEIENIAQWLGAFRKQYPRHRVIAAAGLSGFGPLTTLGLAPLYLAPYHSDDFNSLIHKWNAAWQVLAARTRKRPAAGEAEPEMVTGWLSTGNRGRSIFEVTLKIWAAFAGDARGPKPADWVQSYLQRHNLRATGERALGRYALELLHKDVSGLTRQNVRELFIPFFNKADGNPESDPNAFIEDQLTKRLLVKQGRDRLAFAHPLVAAYCAAYALAADPERAQPTLNAMWQWALHFLAPLADLTPHLSPWLNRQPDILQTETLACARWLRDTPPTAPWRNDVFRRLSVLALDTGLPENLRLRALTAFVASADPNVVALFRQALTSQDPFTRRIAALGLGALGEANAVTALAPLFNDPYLDVRWAAALALAILGNEVAVTALKQGMNNGDDAVRQACAQALARHADLGHDVLREGMAAQHLSTRRAALFGLAETHAEWAPPIIEKAQREDSEWLVRTSAEVLMNRFAARASQPPVPYVAPEKQGWLIAWAAAHGMAVPPGRAAIEVVNRALRDGEEPARLAAAEALARFADPAAARELYPALKDPQSALVRDAAFRALNQLGCATGQRMSAPV